MKNLVVFTLISLLCIACKPEPMLEKIDGMQTENEPVIEESSSMKKIEQIAEVHLTVPDSTWSIKITNIVKSQDEIGVICQLIQSDMMGMMVISEVTDAVKFEALKLPVKYYIKGKTWDWDNSESYIFLDKMTTMDVANSEKISFERIKPSKRGGPKTQNIEM